MRRVPLIISGPAAGEAPLAGAEFARIAATLLKQAVKTMADEKKRTTASPNPALEVEDHLGVKNPYESATPYHWLPEQPLRRRSCSHNKDYVVIDGEVLDR